MKTATELARQESAWLGLSLGEKLLRSARRGGGFGHMVHSFVRRHLSAIYWPARRRWKREIKHALGASGIKALRTKEGRRAGLWWLLGKVGPKALRVRTDKGLFAVHTADRVLGRRLFLDRCYDFDIFGTLMSLLESEGFFQGAEKTFVDVGANIGIQTISALHSRRFSWAICFEPEPSNFSLLQRNIDMNGYRTRCELHQVAIGPKNGVMTLELSGDNYGDHRLRFTDAPGSKRYKEHLRATCEVPVQRLDDVAKGLRAFDCLLKLDVQGAEASILSHGARFLSRCPALLCEFWPYGLLRNDALSVYQEILQLHFSAFYDLRDGPIKRPTGDLPLLVSRYGGKSSTDLLLLK